MNSENNSQTQPVIMPEGFTNTLDGLCFSGTDKGQADETISPQRITPIAIVCNRDKNKNIHVRLECINYANITVIVNVNLQALKTGEERIIPELAGQGVFINSKGKLFTRFIEACCQLPLVEYRLVERPGFQENEFIFLHGHDALFMPERENIDGVCLSNSMDVHGAAQSKGTAEEWCDNVAQKLQGMPQIFAALSGFSSPLLSLLGQSGGMFHLFGGSSTGKTLALQVCASVNGLAGEPGAGENTLIARWRTTVNGLELLTARSHGMTLPLDELGSFAERSFAPVLYDIVSGMSKVRMDGETGGAFAQRLWTLFILSSGEVSLEEKIHSLKEVSMDGMQHRGLSIEVRAEDSWMPEENADQARRRIDQLKSAMCDNHGSVGKAFVRQLISQRDAEGRLLSQEETSCWLKTEFDSLHEEMQRRIHSTDTELNQVESRALQRFSVIFLAGDLARRWSLVPWGHDMISDIVYEAYRRWLNNHRYGSGSSRGLLVMLQNQLSRIYGALVDFKATRSSGEGRDIGGYRVNEDIFIMPDTLDNWGKAVGMTAKRLAALLDEHHFLTRKERDRLTTRITINGVLANGYLIRHEFLTAKL